MCSRKILGETSSPELLALVRGALEELAGRAAPDSAVAALEEARELGRALDVGEAALAVLVAHTDSSGVCRHEGYPATVSWLRLDLGMTHSRASERIALARQLPRLERTRKLLSHGGLSAAYAREICHAVMRLDDVDTLVAEDILLGLVDSGAGVREVARAAARITDLVREQRGLEPEPEDGRRDERRSWLRRSRSRDGGSWVKGWLSAVDEACFAQIVDPLAKPAGKDDPRDTAERAADALMSVLTQGGRAAGVTVIADLGALSPQSPPTPPADSHQNPKPATKANRTSAHTGTSPHEGTSSPSGTSPHTGTSTHSGTSPRDGTSSHSDASSHNGTSPRSRTSPDSETSAQIGLAEENGTEGSGTEGNGLSAGRGSGARLLNGTAVSLAQARRIALTSGINLLLLGKNGHPLYLGRRVRFATPAQRRVLEALYATCAVVGCDIPAHLCEIHHLSGGWKFGTPTNIDQLVPACRFHNAWVEDHPNQITTTHDHTGRTQLIIHRREDRPTGIRPPRGSATQGPAASSGKQQPQGP
jgi:hypothetical protein